MGRTSASPVQPATTSSTVLKPTTKSAPWIASRPLRVSMSGSPGPTPTTVILIPALEDVIWYCSERSEKEKPWCLSLPGFERRIGRDTQGTTLLGAEKRFLGNAGQVSWLASPAGCWPASRLQWRNRGGFTPPSPIKPMGLKWRPVSGFRMLTCGRTAQPM